MKKFILGSLFLFFACAQAHAISDIEISGEADIGLQAHLLPSGDSGENAFTIPTLLLNLSAPLQEGNMLYLSIEGSDKLDDDTKNFLVNTREAYLDLVSVFHGMHALRLGLIADPWLEAGYEDYEYRFLGPTGWSITEKWRYTPYSDLGGAFMSELPHDWGEWAFTIQNGTGREVDQTVRHKDAAIFLRFARWSQLVFSANYVRGNYDKYADNVNTKERIQASVLYRGDAEKWKAGLELLDTHDPADAIMDLKMADNVDLMNLTGQAVHGQAASAWGSVRTGPKAEVMLRCDYLNAAVGQSGKDQADYIGALSYQVTNDIRGAFETDYVQYGGNYGNGNRDSWKVAIATQVLF